MQKVFCAAIIPSLFLAPEIVAETPDRARSASSIDVVKADGDYVLEPLVAGDQYDESVANRNTLRIQAIMKRARPLHGLFSRRKVLFQRRSSGPDGHH